MVATAAVDVVAAAAAAAAVEGADARHRTNFADAQQPAPTRGVARRTMQPLHLASLTLCAGALLASAAQAQVTPTHADLVYATVGPAPLELDLYLPAGAPAPRPTLVFIHGGGWSGGDKAPIPALCVAALNQGFAVASVNYRLTSQAALFAPESVTFPAQIHDVKGAVRWLRANAATFGLDPTRFASFGTSAGGHLSALLATSGGSAELEGAVGGNLGFSSRVQAAIDYFGPTDLIQMQPDVLTPPGSVVDHDAPSSGESQLIGWSLPGQGMGDLRANLTNPAAPYPALVQITTWANPITWVEASDPPLFIGHGTNDPVVPVRQSSRLSAALFAAGVEHDFRAVPLAGHFLSGAISDAALAFLRAKLLGPDRLSVGTPLCAGDSSLDACPCGNTSFDGAQTGCVHSLFVGANLNAVGSASIAADSVELRADSMPNGSVLFFQGPLLVSGGVVLDDGLRCVASPLTRLATKINVQGFARYPAVGEASVSVRGGAVAGQTVHYQAWYRDPAPHCTSGTANLTNALSITWTP